MHGGLLATGTKTAGDRCTLKRGRLKEFKYICQRFEGRKDGGLAQLARALAWHARGHRFDSDILHHSLNDGVPWRYAVFVAC